MTTWVDSRIVAAGQKAPLGYHEICTKISYAVLSVHLLDVIHGVV